MKHRKIAQQLIVQHIPKPPQHAALHDCLLSDGVQCHCNLWQSSPFFFFCRGGVATPKVTLLVL